MPSTVQLLYCLLLDKQKGTCIKIHFRVPCCSHLVESLPFSGLYKITGNLILNMPGGKKKWSEFLVKVSKEEKGKIKNLNAHISLLIWEHKMKFLFLCKRVRNHSNFNICLQTNNIYRHANTANSFQIFKKPGLFPENSLGLKNKCFLASKAKKCGNKTHILKYYGFRI